MKRNVLLTMLLLVVLSFSLCAQNINIKAYPNPFNSKVTIVLPSELKSDEANSFQIYNAKGQLIKGWLDTKDLSITWDGKDNLGKKVPQGIYYYKMTNGKYTASKKIILVK